MQKAYYMISRNFSRMPLKQSKQKGCLHVITKYDELTDPFVRLDGSFVHFLFLLCSFSFGFIHAGRKSCVNIKFPLNRLNLLNVRAKGDVQFQGASIRSLKY